MERKQAELMTPKPFVFALASNCLVAFNSGKTLASPRLKDISSFLDKYRKKKNIREITVHHGSLTLFCIRTKAALRCE